MNKRVTTGLLLISTVLFMLTFSACTSQRSVIKKPLKQEGEAFLISKMEASELNFDWFSARCNISLINDKKHKSDFRGQLRIKKDSVIWVSLSPALGIEVARLMITQDSIRFLNRIDKTFFEGDYALINSFFQTTVDFDMLQALLIGNDLVTYEDDAFRASVDGFRYKLSANHRMRKKKELLRTDDPNILVQSIWLNPDNFKIVSVNMKEFGVESKKLEADYSHFEAVGSQLFPTDLRMELQAGKKIEIKISFSNFKLDEPQSFPFNIPGKYDRMR